MAKKYGQDEGKNPNDVNGWLRLPPTGCMGKSCCRWTNRKTNVMTKENSNKQPTNRNLPAEIQTESLFHPCSSIYLQSVLFFFWIVLTSFSRSRSLSLSTLWSVHSFNLCEFWNGGMRLSSSVYKLMVHTNAVAVCWVFAIITATHFHHISSHHVIPCHAVPCHSEYV